MMDRWRWIYMSDKIRLQKAIAESGYCSRRKAEQLMLDNKVKVNGNIVNELGFKVGPKDQIEVNNILLEKEEHVYYLINKPKQVLSSVSDDRGREVIVDYIDEQRRIFPVGRLDYDTTGLLILTNDGEFSNAMIHPKFEMSKVYDVVLDKIVTVSMIKQLESGIELDGFKTIPTRVKIRNYDKNKQMTNLTITLREGRNRQIKRMFEALGVTVVRLHRKQFGFLTLDGLDINEYRRLKPFEVKKLMQAAQVGER
ncbi:MAG: rRNA pseudouridine synthase [Erysipelothrix sp.]|nr:rRNA pseudouridine synthase [Erysipelothrix sp.]